jgi:hypothetical protein
MSVSKQQLVNALSGYLPREILDNLVSEYLYIKQQYFLRKFRPSELSGARFAEIILRLLEFLDTGIYTPLGVPLKTDSIIRHIENNTRLADTIHLLIPRLTRVILDVRNKRDVAHVGGEVNPNQSDSIFIVHSTDWIMTEIIRYFHKCSIDEARRIIVNINETKVPVVAEVDGFVRVQNTSLEFTDKTMVILYYKLPEKVSDADLLRWTKYSNSSRYKTTILSKLDKEALIHYENGFCTLLPKGVLYVEKNIPLSLIS